MKIFIVIVALAICFCSSSADAAVSYTVTQTNPVPAAAISNMRTTSPITFRISNTSSAGETITAVRFRILNTTATCGTAPCTRTVFSNTTANPAGWTHTFAAATITFTASAVGNRIPAGGSQDFTIVFSMGNMTVDFTQTLRDVRATFSTGATSLINTPGSWKLLSLGFTSFQTTDCAGTPIATLTAGNNFCLVMTVQNNSSVAQNGIVSNPNPPAGANISIVPAGSVTPGLISTTYAPSPLNLAVLAIGTITFRYSTAGTDNGTIQFININAQRGATVTSIPRNSNILTVSRLTIGIAITGPLAGSPSCVFTGDNATFTMTITNNTPAPVTNVTPAPAVVAAAFPLLCPALPAAQTRTCFFGTGSAAIGAVAGPVPATIANLAIGANGTFTWIATVTATIDLNPKSTFFVTGFVTYNAGVPSIVATANAEEVDGYVVSLNPASTNASSTYEELIWSVTNHGCANIQQVSIAGSNPAGWIWTGGDSYSLVGNSYIETWTPGGANPPQVFSASTVPEQLNKLEAGSFSLIFPTTPTTAGTYTFNVTITDANATPIVKTLPTTITVNPFNTGGLNATGTGVWHEDIK